ITAFVVIGGSSVSGFLQGTSTQTTPKPFPAPARWLPLIGEYGVDSEGVIVLEKEGRLNLLFKRTELEPLREISTDIFQFESGSLRAGNTVEFSRDPRGKV